MMPTKFILIDTPELSDELQAAFADQAVIKPIEWGSLSNGHVALEADLCILSQDAANHIESFSSRISNCKYVLVPVLEKPLYETTIAIPELKQRVFGYNPWRGALTQSVWELSCYKDADQNGLLGILANLNISAEFVADQVGLVTPRVIAMIINEGYFTLEEGTASKEDIDLSMKLGVNYPYGPFEWGQKIGIQNVLKLLDAMFEYSHDQRYKASLLLRREAAML